MRVPWGTLGVMIAWSTSACGDDGAAAQPDAAPVDAPSCVPRWAVSRGIAAGSGPHLAADSTGGLHAVFMDANRDFVFADIAGSAVTTQPVDSMGVLDRHDVTIDANGGVHLVYSRDTQLRYAYRPPAGTWSLESIDTQHSYLPSVAVGADGAVHVAYENINATGTMQTLRYARRAPAGGWTVEVPPEPATNVFGPGVAVAADGSVSVSYEAGAVRFASRTAAGAWTFSTVDAATTQPRTKVVLDASGGPHVTYFRGNGDFVHARRLTDGTWFASRIDTVGLQQPGNVLAEYHSLAIDASGALHVAYEDGTGQDIKYASGPSDGVLVPEVLDTQSNLVEPSLAIAGGTVHVVYYDEVARNISYARQCR